MASISSQSSLNAKIKAICDIMRRSNAAGALQYVPEISWMLFLRILDEREALEQTEAKIVGAPFTPSLAYPYRWQDWASPAGKKRKELQDGMSGDVFGFIEEDLFPHLHDLKDQPGATTRQKVISEIMSERVDSAVDTERNFLDVIDKVDEIRQEGIDPTHMFTLSQAYEALLLSMGQKNNDGGQFFTPREVIRAIVRVVDPKVGETVYDPACGTGGFLAQSYEHMKENLGPSATAGHLTTLANDTFYGREKEQLAYPIGLANLVHTGSHIVTI